MKKILWFTLILVWSSICISMAQTCTSNPLTIPTSRNFSAIAWTSTGGAVCPPAANFTGNIRIDLPNGVNITMNTSINISGNFRITNSGSSTLTIPAGVTVHVGGNMGDAANNNVSYVVNGVLIVDGTLSGNNGNSFSGTGTIAGGTLDVKNGATCGSPCPVTGNFDNCSSGTGGSAQVFCNNVLPVTLLYFNASVAEDIVSLTWATTMEKDFSKFVIERSADGLRFEEIGEVAGAGFDQYDIESSYDFQDEAPLLGYNYYRLRAVDLDGYFESFGVKAVQVKGGKKLSVYPNPSAGDLIKFRTNFTAEEGDKIVLVDQLGVEILSTRADGIRNTISLSDKLRNGIYTLRYISRDFDQTVKIVVKN